MAPVLTVISDFIGILGGWVVARFQLQVSSGLYWSSISKGLYMQDIWMGITKPFVFGFIIVTIACHVGSADHGRHRRRRQSRRPSRSSRVRWR
jgi:phospholipid/cholesterol/gamma-HCH transport system permease protein